MNNADMSSVDQQRPRNCLASSCEASLAWEHIVATIALKIREQLELAAVLQVTVDEVQALLACDRVLVYQFAPDWSGRVVVEAVTESRWSILGKVVHDSCFVADWLQPYTENHYFATEDVATAGLSPCHTDFLGQFHVRANLVIPILKGGKLWGLLIAHHCTEPRSWSPKEISGLQQIAVHVGIAVYQADLVEQLQRAKATLAAQVDQRTQSLNVANAKLRHKMRQYQRTANELRQHQDQLRQLAAIVESSQDAIISTTMDGIVTSWNRAAERLFGYTAVEMIGQSVCALVPPERQAETGHGLEQVVQETPVKPYETQRLTKAGWLVDVSITISPIYDRDGQVIGVSKIARDIRDRKRQEHLHDQAQQALSDSQQRFHSFMNHAPLLSWTINRHDSLDYVNAAWLDFVGRSEADVLGHTLDELFPPALAEVARYNHHYVFETGQMVETCEQAIAQDGSVRSLLVRKFPVYEDGQITAVGGIGIDITEQKHAEILLHQQAETLRIFYDTSPLMMGIVETTDNDILHISDNPTILAFLGKTADQLTNRWSSELGIPPEAMQHWLAQYHQSQQQQRPVQFSYDYVTPSGCYSLLATVSFLGMAKSGRPQFSYIVQDLTEIRRLQGENQQISEQLIESEQRYASLVAAVPVGIFRTDPVGQMLYVNAGWEQLAGLKSAQAAGNGWLQAIHPDDREVVATVWQQAIRMGQRFELEYRCLSPTGAVAWVYGRAVAEYAATGERVGYVGSVTDISDRKQAEAAQHQAEQMRLELRLLEQLVDVVLSGYWDWHLPTHEEYLSPGFKQFLGYADHELSNSPDTWQQLIFSEDLPGTMATLNRHFASGGRELFSVEVRYRHKDGSTVWVICAGQVIEWDDGGNPLRMIGCHIDITQRKQTEEALRHSEATKQALIQAIPDFLSRMRPDGTQIEVINAGNVNFLYPAGTNSIAGYAISDIMPLDIAQERIHLAQVAIATGDVQYQEYEFTDQQQIFYEEARIIRISESEVLVVVRDITRQKRAEIALRTSEIHHRALLYALPDLLIRMRADGTYLHYSIGNTVHIYRPDQFHAGTSCFDVLPLDLAQAQLATAQRALQTEELQVYEYDLEINGETRTEEARVVPCGTDEVLIVVRDVSDRKRAELALQESEARYRNIIETTPEGVWMLDAEGKITFANQQMADLLGYPLAELVGLPLVQCFAPPDQPIIKNHIRHGQSTQAPQPIRLHRQDGSELWVMVSSTPHLDQAKQVTEVVGMLTDITPLVSTQEALKTSEMQLSSILNSSLDGIMAFQSVRNNQGQIIDFEWLLVNPVACEIVHKSPATLIGNRMLVELPGNRDEGLFDQYVQVVASGETTRQQFHYNHDGIDRWFENIAVKLGDGFVVTFRDITLIKQSEHRFQQLNQQMEIHVDHLKKRNAEMLMLSKTSDFLQACRSIPEACAVISTLVRPLFPHCVGAIYLTSASRNRLEQVAAWGSQAEDPQHDFAPHDCWGLRRGRLHLVRQGEVGLQCNHSEQVSDHAETLCIPMIAQGETLGLFYLQSDEPELLLEMQQLAQTVAEQIGLAIANLHLRETLQNQSIRDPLTGLFNRRYLEESLQQEISRAGRNHSEISVIMLDVDHFKRFNDEYGHEAGDLVLQSIGQLLRSQVRGSDIICRYGGEELTLVFPESSLAEACVRADELRIAISQLKIVLHNTPLSNVTVSLGVAAFPHHGTTGAALLQVADAALYRAKAAGRNQVIAAPVRSAYEQSWS